MLSTSESACKLTYGVIETAVRDALNGDRDAAQFLVAPDGAELWIRANGLGITNEMRAVLRLLAIGEK
jgi:hypothetical protein